MSSTDIPLPPSLGLSLSHYHGGDEFHRQVLHDLALLRDGNKQVEEVLRKIHDQHAGVEQAIQQLRSELQQGYASQDFASGGIGATQFLHSDKAVGSHLVQGPALKSSLARLAASPSSFGVSPTSSILPPRRLLGNNTTSTAHSVAITEDSRVSSTRSQRASASIPVIGVMMTEERRCSISSEAIDQLPPTLPHNWPSCLRARATGRSDRASRAAIHGGSFNNISVSRSQIIQLHISTRTWVLDPNSLKRLAVDLLGFVMLLYDMTCLPYLLAWDVEIYGVHHIIYYTSAIYWTFDLILNFFTGFVKEGEVVRDSLSKAARHYLMSNFLMDLMLVLLGWISLLGEIIVGRTDGARQVKVLRMAKLSRGLRIFALLRLFRLTRFLEEQVERSLSESTRLALRIACVFFAVVWTTHLVACGWYACGDQLESDTGGKWTQIPTADGGLTYKDAPLSFQYFSAYHWAMTQMTLGGSDLSPRNTGERVFAVVSLMLGLLCSLTLVSSTSTAMIEWKLNRQEQKEKVKVLRKYLRQSCVDSKLALRVQRQIMSRIHPRHRLTDAEVPALQLLSTPLRQELMFSVFRPHLTKHMIMRLYDELDAITLRKVCDLAASSRFVMREDPVFEPLEQAEGAYVVTQGLLTYIQEPDTAPVDARVTEDVLEGAWIAEAALWSEWIHVGSPEAVTHCNVICLNAEQMVTAMQTSACTPLNRFIRSYGKLFSDRIVASCPPNNPWPSDLRVPNTSWWELCMCLSLDTQQALSLACLEKWHLKQGNWVLSATRGYTQLREEVSRHAAMLMLGDRGQLERFVCVGLIRVTSLDDTILVEVMRYQEDVPFSRSGLMNQPHLGKKHVCRLPGAKQERGEVIKDTFERILNEKLGPIKDQVELSSYTTCPEVTSAEGAQGDVHTKYFRTIAHASLTSNQACERARLDLETQITCRDVYVDGNGGGSRYFAWMSEEEFVDLTSSKQGEATLRDWLNAIETAIRGLGEAPLQIRDMAELISSDAAKSRGARRRSSSGLSMSGGSFGSIEVEEVDTEEHPNGTDTQRTWFEADADSARVIENPRKRVAGQGLPMPTRLEPPPSLRTYGYGSEVGPSLPSEKERFDANKPVSDVPESDDDDVHWVALA